MRYFLIAFTCNLIDSASSNGNLCFDCDEFPSNAWIKNVAAPKVFKNINTETIVVNNIYEFKNESDYLKFIEPLQLPNSEQISTDKF